MTRRVSGSVLSGALALAAGLAVGSGCRKTNLPSELALAPSVRLYFMSSVAGALEPCGCRKDMLGGVDHAAAFLATQHDLAPRRLLLSVGPLLFQDPILDPARSEQDSWKAETLAASLADLELSAWAPGVNDFAKGENGLRQSAGSIGAKMLGANLALPEFTRTALFQVGNYKVGVAGIAAAPEGVATNPDTAQALEAAASELTRDGAQIRVALIAAPRGDALRLVEKVAGFDVVAIGKPLEQGDANDAASPPTLIGDTLVLQAPNHLQALAYVDLFVKADGFQFADASRIADLERKDSLKGRIEDLERRTQSARAQSDAERTRAFESELGRLKGELAQLGEKQKVVAEPSGSFFKYELVEVRESAGSEPKVAARMLDYYRRVNEHNRLAFKDRSPAPAPSGSAHYIGDAICGSCHADATVFWKTTGHAAAYATLSREFKEFNLDCVGCHVTGYNRPGGSTVTHVERLTNVQCEACHGPGSRHVEAGGNSTLITLSPPESTCRSCHHAPHVADDWDLKQSWQKIIGPGHGHPAAPTKP